MVKKTQKSALETSIMTLSSAWLLHFISSEGDSADDASENVSNLLSMQSSFFWHWIPSFLSKIGLEGNGKTLVEINKT